MENALMTTYGRLPVRFEKGEGAWLWDDQGNSYLDALSGIAVCGLGHAHPGVTAALQEQAAKLIHTSNLYEIPLQEELAARLCAAAGMDNAFFCNSGAEANEAAIKLARLHGHNRGMETPNIIVTEGAFHGRTLATLTATGNRKVQAGFEPLVSGFIRVPYDDLDAVNRVATSKHEVAAVLVEPVQGEGGIRIPDPAYLRGLREICDRNGWLLMVDEIQTGMGRTGRWFAFQHDDSVRPDVVTVAKALGNGVPMGCCMARGEAAGVFKPGSHGSTFGGTPLACAAALAVVDALNKDNLPARAEALGHRLADGFAAHLGQVSGVREIRSQGLMLGIVLDRPCVELVRQALERGLLLNVTAERVVRLLPPLIITDDEAARIVDEVSDLIVRFLGDSESR